MINKLEKNKKVTLEKLAHMVEQGFLNVDKKFEAVDKKFEAQEKKFDAKLDTQSKSFDDKLEGLARMVQDGFSEVTKEMATKKELQELRNEVNEGFKALDLRLFRETSTAEKDRELLDKRLRAVERQ